VVVARFGASNPVTKVTFNSITCDEGGSYTWSAVYYDDGEKTVTAKQQITVKGNHYCIVKVDDWYKDVKASIFFFALRFYKHSDLFLEIKH